MRSRPSPSSSSKEAAAIDPSLGGVGAGGGAVAPFDAEAEEATMSLDEPSTAVLVSTSDSASSRTVRRAGALLPGPWLERLLALSLDLPVSTGATACAQAVVDLLGELLPRHRVTVRLLEGERAVTVRPALGARGEGPTGSTGGARPSAFDDGFDDATATGEERVLFLDGSGACTLHISPVQDLGSEEGTSAAATSLGATILRRALEQVAVHARLANAEADLHALQAHMVQAEKLASLGQIAAGVVHELNNPLTSIIAYTEVLLRKATSRPDPEGDADRLRRIGASADRMLRFTRDLVSYARPSSETPIPVDVSRVAEQALAFCEHVLGDARVEVERHFDPFVPLVRGKPEQLAQVFVNLITNACHAVQEVRGRAGKLVLRTAKTSEGVVVTLHDNGCGITEEHVKRIFAPFFTTKGTGMGTGLGLTIVKGIVEAHAGTIEVTSHTFGADVGTVFTLRFPAAT